MPSRARVLLLGLVAVAVAVPAAADEPGASLRLLVAGVHDGPPDVGIEIALAPGWKTYWRTPGDAGMAPSFDVSASRGLASFAVRYPFPERFAEGDFTSIGYAAPVILPIDLAAADPAVPIDLDVVAHVGLCREICVPLEAHLTARIDPAGPVDTALAARIAEARKAVPIAAGPTTLPRIVAIERIGEGSAPPTIGVTVVGPAASPDEAADLLVEGPTPDWALAQPTRAMRLAPPPGSGDLPRLVWEFSLDGVPKSADTKATPLRFTFRAGSAAVEQTVGLDGSGVLP